MSQTYKRISVQPQISSQISIEDVKAPHSSSIKLKQKLTEMNKTIFRSKLIPDKIEKLEKEALRGEGTAVPEAKPSPVTKKEPDFLTLILKSEHKTSSEGTKIVKLPKLPFGQHRSYNEEPQFRDKHFLDGSILLVDTERLKDLEDITRKFRLQDKKYKACKQSRLGTDKLLLTDFSNCEVFNMGPGTLVCEKQHDVIESYERNKTENQRTSRTVSNKKPKKDSPVDKYLFRKTLNFNKEQKLVSRLMPAPETKDSTMSLFFTTKYSSLFEVSDKKSSSSINRRLSL